MSESDFNFKIASAPEKIDEIKSRIESVVSDIESKHGDVTVEERKKIGDLLNYGHTPVDNICYDHYKARLHKLMFPGDESLEGGPRGFVRRFYRKVLRRLLRQQLVFNQSVVGTLDDMHKRLSAIEEKLGIGPKNKES